MYRDFINGSMIGYIVMLVVTSVLAYVGKYTKCIPVVILGNLISLAVSFLFIINVVDEMWMGYFKPLLPIQLLILVSILNIIPQLFAIRLANKRSFKKIYNKV